MRTEVAVVGAGAIGGTYAARLATGGDRAVTLCVRRAFDRLVVDDRVEGVRREVDAGVLTDPAGAEPVDVVLVATKAHQTAGALPWLDRLVGPTTTVAVLQNGVEHVARMEGRVPSDQVVPTLVYIGGYVEAPGRVVNTNLGATVLPDTERGRQVAELLRATGMPVQVSQDFTTAAWRKLGVNVAASPTTTLFQVPARAVGRVAGIRAMASGLVSECLAVGRAHGAVFEAGEGERILDELGDYPEQVTSSMCRDRAAGRELEVDALLGAVVRGGRSTGVPTPRAEEMTELVEQVAALPMAR